MSRKDKPIEIESRLVVAWGSGVKGGRQTGRRDLLGGDGNVLKLDCGNGYPIFTKKPNCTLKEEGRKKGLTNKWRKENEGLYLGRLGNGMEGVIMNMRQKWDSLRDRIHT